MIVMYNKENLLHARVVMDLRLAIPYQAQLFEKGKQERLLLPEEVMYILTRNGNLKIWNGEKFIKLNLGQFYDVIKNKDYVVENYVEPKKEEVNVQPKVVEQPKQAELKQQQKVEPKKEEVNVQPEVNEEPKHQQNENKKQRHNNKQNQGGDK